MSFESDLAAGLAAERFYGAKTAGVDAARVEHAADFDGVRAAVVAARHGETTERYQMLVDAAGHDVLGEHADALGAALAGGRAPLGQLHGDASVLAGLHGRALGQEQSNSTLIYSDETGPKVAVKFFRKLAPGLNPEIELLSGIGEVPAVPRLHAWVDAEIDGEPHALAVVQEFIADSRDGWLDAVDVAAEGASLAERARLLGAATREVHEALAGAFGTTELSGDGLAERLGARLDSLVTQAPELADVADEARRRYARLYGTAGTAQRVHGDLHLGQVLFTGERYVLLDFEGEPARPLAERRLPDSPARDLAGLIRSIDYAAHFNAYSGRPGPTDPARWAAEATEALLEGYGALDAQAVPAGWLDAYVLDKALYEVAYEANNRPDWAGIPRAAVTGILG